MLKRCVESLRVHSCLDESFPARRTWEGNGSTVISTGGNLKQPFIYTRVERKKFANLCPARIAEKSDYAGFNKSVRFLLEQVLESMVV